MTCEFCKGLLTKPWQTRFCSRTCRSRVISAARKIDRTTICKVCGAEVVRRKRTGGAGVVCSDACLRESRRLTAVENVASGKGPPRNVMTDEQRNIARERITGARAPWWNGAKERPRVRYVMIHPADYPHPESLDAQGYITEHRAVMEAHLGRALLATEVVHHINEDRRDNRIENLMLFASQSDHMRHHRADK